MTRKRASVAKLQQLESLAEIQARGARQRLLALRRAEAEIVAAVARLDARKQAALAEATGGDAASTAVFGAWLRWATEERRKLLTDQAKLRARALTAQQENARLVARHAALSELTRRQVAAERARAAARPCV